MFDLDSIPYPSLTYFSLDEEYWDEDWDKNEEEWWYEEDEDEEEWWDEEEWNEEVDEEW